MADDKSTRLWDLMRANPDLPVVPMVSNEVVAGDEWAYWMGSWGYAEVTEFILVNDRVYFKTGSDPEDVLADTPEYCDKWEELTDEQIKTTYDNLPWQKSIVVYIEM